MVDSGGGSIDDVQALLQLLGQKRMNGRKKRDELGLSVSGRDDQDHAQRQIALLLVEVLIHCQEHVERAGRGGSQEITILELVPPESRGVPNKVSLDPPPERTRDAVVQHNIQAACAPRFLLVCVRASAERRSTAWACSLVTG